MLIYLVRISHVHFSLLWYAFLIYSPGLHLIWRKLFFLEMMRLFTVKEAARWACFFLCVCVSFLPFLPLSVSLLSPLHTWQWNITSAVLFTLECSIVFEMIGLWYSESGMSPCWHCWFPSFTCSDCLNYGAHPSLPNSSPLLRSTPSQLKERREKKMLYYTWRVMGKKKRNTELHRFVNGWYSVCACHWFALLSFN